MVVELYRKGYFVRITDHPIISDIKKEYVQLRQNGQSREESTQLLIQNHMETLIYPMNEAASFFWIGVADAQYSRKELTDTVAQKAQSALNVLSLSNLNITPGDIERRRSHYLQAPMSEKKIGKPRRKYQCTWKIGDVFALELTSERAQKLNIAHSFILYQKVDEILIYNGCTIPIVTLAFCNFSDFPVVIDKFKEVPHLRLSCGRWGSSEKKFEYRAQLIIDNRRQINISGLKFIGNYPVRDAPQDEQRFSKSSDILMMPLTSIEMLSCSFWEVDNYFRNK